MQLLSHEGDVVLQESAEEMRAAAIGIEGEGERASGPIVREAVAQPPHHLLPPAESKTVLEIQVVGVAGLGYHQVIELGAIVVELQGQVCSL